jgi:hypothetical protein
MPQAVAAQQQQHDWSLTVFTLEAQRDNLSRSINRIRTEFMNGRGTANLTQAATTNATATATTKSRATRKRMSAAQKRRQAELKATAAAGTAAPATAPAAPPAVAAKNRSHRAKSIARATTSTGAPPEKVMHA